MPLNKSRLDETKRKVRKLKQAEITLRFGGVPRPNAKLIWNDFFYGSDAKYPVSALAAMDKNAYKNVTDEFFSYVYYEYYKENGITSAQTYDPSLLALLELSVNADGTAVKRRFRELAKAHHPDIGGDASKFIALMDTYRRLLP